MVPLPDMDPGPPIDVDRDDPDVAMPLWRELVDGTAGPVVKGFVSLGLIPLFIGLGLVASYVLGGILQGGMRPYGPDDDIVAAVLLVCGFLYLVSVAWLWTRQRRRHAAIWKAVAYTGAVALITILAGLWIEANLRSAGEILIVGTVFLAGAVVILIWIEAARAYVKAKPLADRSDGMLDVRCPACRYRMVGLHESRCPECGTSYTLDGLLGQQDFLTRVHRRRASATRIADQPPAP